VLIDTSLILNDMRVHPSLALSPSFLVFEPATEHICHWVISCLVCKYRPALPNKRKWFLVACKRSYLTIISSYAHS